jgi:hypothetical protein
MFAEIFRGWSHESHRESPESFRKSESHGVTGGEEAKWQACRKTTTREYDHEKVSLYLQTGFLYMLGEKFIAVRKHMIVEIVARPPPGRRDCDLARTMPWSKDKKNGRFMTFQSYITGMFNRQGGCKNCKKEDLSSGESNPGLLRIVR